MCLLIVYNFPVSLSTFFEFPSQGSLLKVWLDWKELCLYRTLINCSSYVEEEGTKGPSRDVATRKEWPAEEIRTLLLKVLSTDQQRQHLGAWKTCGSSGPYPRPAESESELNRIICVHITVCTGLEERRAVLLGARMAKPRWLKRWLKLAILPRTLLEQCFTPWFPKQVGHLTHYLQIHISRSYPRDSDSTDLRRGPKNLHV